jgi:hypothetical protein
MNIRTVALVLGGSMLAAGITAATACSSGSGSGSPSGHDGGGEASFGDGSGSSSGSGSSGSSSGGSSGGSSSGATDAAADCKTPPVLHPDDGGNIYCPFGPDGSAIECSATTTVCCIGGGTSGNYQVSKCQDKAMDCDNPAPDAAGPARRVECEDSLNCGTTGVCCAKGGVPSDMGCGFPLEKPSFSATRCVTDGGACGSGEFQLCSEATGECPMGMTCVAARTSIGVEIGFCM